MKRHKTKYLIINADDFNLTSGVSRAILYAAESDVISSTSVFINGKGVCYLTKLKRIPSCGVGLHFNVTLGKPVAKPYNVKSLITRRGFFIPRERYRFNQIEADDVFIELELQIKKFVTIFQHLPTHINTHHHVHFYKKIYSVLYTIARKYQIPIRKRYFKKSLFEQKGIITTDYVYGRYSPKQHWTRGSLLHVIHMLKSGVSELIVHPGFSNGQLMKKSSFNIQREEELRALCSEEFSNIIKEKGVVIINFNDLKWLKRKF